MQRGNHSKHQPWYSQHCCFRTLGCFVILLFILIVFSTSKSNHLLPVGVVKLGPVRNKTPPVNVSSARKVEERKTIFYLGNLWKGMNRFLQFDGCEYSNCKLAPNSNNVELAKKADAIIFAQTSKHVTMKVPFHIRQKQLWFVYGVESPVHPTFEWNKAINDFNGTLTYSHTSIPFYIPYGLTLPLSGNISSPSTINYAKGKSKGAYAYVSNCQTFTRGYNRLQLMKELGKYVQIDIFGQCTGKQPCRTRFETECMSRVHSKYRFYLAFENSLCTEYITEKFWRTLESDQYFVPVAFGGMSVEEYSNIAPPDSFIHAYNFTSIKELGLYLNRLMTDDVAYNRYHAWRLKYKAKIVASQATVCNFCKIINHPDMLAKTRGIRFADEWNKEENCAKFPPKNFSRF